MSKESFFTVFCMEKYSDYKSITGREVASLFEKYGVFDYLEEFYDVLHTTDSSYINHDIDSFIAARQ